MTEFALVAVSAVTTREIDTRFAARKGSVAFSAYGAGLLTKVLPPFRFIKDASCFKLTSRRWSHKEHFIRFCVKWV